MQKSKIKTRKRRPVARKQSERKPRKEKKQSILRKKIFKILLGVAVIGYTYVFFISPIFIIDRIVVENKSSSGSDIEQINKLINDYVGTRKYLFFSTQNIFVFSKKDVKEIVENYINLENIKVKRKIPNKIEIVIEERLPSLSWRELDGRSYYLNESGQVLKEKTSNSFDYQIFTVENATSTTLTYEKESNVMSPEIVTFIKSTKESFDREIQDFTIAKAVLDLNIKNEVTFVSNEGWKIFLSMKVGESSAKDIELVINEKIKERRLDLNYIDARIPGKIFYTYK